MGTYGTMASWMPTSSWRWGLWYLAELSRASLDFKAGRWGVGIMPVSQGDIRTEVCAASTNTSH